MYVGDSQNILAQILYGILQKCSKQTYKVLQCGILRKCTRREGVRIMDKGISITEIGYSQRHLISITTTTHKGTFCIYLFQHIPLARKLATLGCVETMFVRLKSLEIGLIFLECSCKYWYVLEVRSMKTVCQKQCSILVVVCYHSNPSNNYFTIKKNNHER